MNPSYTPGRRLPLLLWAVLPFVSPVLAAGSHAPGYPRVILRGDYADPSILRDGADYYMTHSPFFYTPGFLIWHSRDLVHWTPVCRAMTKVVGSAMAPDLVKHGGRYFIYFPAARVNWVIWADNIRGPWSDPIKLDVGHIDPGHVVGEDGKRYLHLSEGHIVPLSDDGLAVAGPKQRVYSGWEFPKEWVTEGMWLESPKLVRKDGYFHLVVAQGGTAGPPTSHMIATARSRSARGPWENSPYNPIVRTASAAEPWWSKGHGTLVDDVNGNWWVVYHAYENGHYPLGRQTLLDPVEWTAHGWVRLARTPHRHPGAGTADTNASLPLSDDFSRGELGLQWTSWREFSGVAVRDGQLALTAKGRTPADARLLLTTAADHAYEVETVVTVPAGGSGGLVLFYSEAAFAGIVSDGRNFTLYGDATRISSEPNRFGRRFLAKIINRRNRCEFLASADGKTWTTLLREVDVSHMHHNTFKGFFALRPGLVALGTGDVTFDDFIYRRL